MTLLSAVRMNGILSSKITEISLPATSTSLFRWTSHITIFKQYQLLSRSIWVSQNFKTVPPLLGGLPSSLSMLTQIDKKYYSAIFLAAVSRLSVSLRWLLFAIAACTGLLCRTLIVNSPYIKSWEFQLHGLVLRISILYSIPVLLTYIWFVWLIRRWGC